MCKKHDIQILQNPNKLEVKSILTSQNSFIPFLNNNRISSIKIQERQTIADILDESN